MYVRSLWLSEAPHLCARDVLGAGRRCRLAHEAQTRPPSVVSYQCLLSWRPVCYHLRDVLYLAVHMNGWPAKPHPLRSSQGVHVPFPSLRWREGVPAAKGGVPSAKGGGLAAKGGGSAETGGGRLRRGLSWLRGRGCKLRGVRFIRID